MSETLIKTENIGKYYRVFDSMNQRLKHLVMHNFGREYGKTFWALNGISFDVKRGESVGIIGDNGAGKSTLLQILTGILHPNEGSAEVNGRVAALLELGSGFNPDFSGRDNVFMNAAILGLSKKEIESRFDEIEAFADIGDFIEQPVKTYSSGMIMRLAFAVTTCVEPDIMIVDEALAVGDAVFQSKCYTRLRQLTERGTSLLFVSHAIDTVRSLCSRALWLEHGKTVMWGDAKEVCKEYEKLCWKKQGMGMEPEEKTDLKIQDFPRVQKVEGIPDCLIEANPNFEALAKEGRYGTGDIRVINFVLTDVFGLPKKAFNYNEEARVNYLLKLNNDIDTDFNIGVRIRNLKGTDIMAVSQISNLSRLTGKKGDLFFASYKFNLPLHHDSYYIRTGVIGYKDGNACVGGIYSIDNLVSFDIIEKTVFFDINLNISYPVAGPVHIHHPLKLEKNIGTNIIEKQGNHNDVG